MSETKKELPQDGPAKVELSAPERLTAGYRPYERFRLTLHEDGLAPLVQERDILRAGYTVGILPYDMKRDAVVLIRQFRLPALLALGPEVSELVEIVAGGVEAGESAEAAALRECREEIHLVPHRLVPMMRMLPTPGIIDECATLFLGAVDAGDLPQRGGAPEEAEVTRPFLIPVDDAVAMVAQNRCVNGYLIIALQWLALNRARLPELLAG